MVTVELISRVPVHHVLLSIARWVSTSAVAGIAAIISYQHMSGVAARYGESAMSSALVPISVDGLVVVASVCLVEVGGRIRALEESAPVSLPVVEDSPVVPAPVDEVAPVPAPVTVDVVETAPEQAPEPAPKQAATSTQRTTRKAGTAHSRKPRTSKKEALTAYLDAIGPDDTRTDAELIRTYAPLVGLHENTARRYLASWRAAQADVSADAPSVESADAPVAVAA
ncbi:DUF2637 domain-containing protein [Frankia sp. EI5c]|uniref:DUF2637 domain-containing protein n=1 Tax=Frankia sp. EI5c TaxID=683316 RepID=UPI0018FE2007|nr:DUF2637 domain-containing protein [Frankia sp. EI5c]